MVSDQCFWSHLFQSSDQNIWHLMLLRHLHWNMEQFAILLKTAGVPV